MSHYTELIRCVVNTAPVSIAMFDAQMCYLAASVGWKKDYLANESDLIGKNHYKLYPDVPERWREIHRKGLSGITQHNHCDLFLRDNGQVHWIDWSLMPWHDENGEIGGIIIYANEITDRVNTEAALAQSLIETIAAISRTVEERDPYTTGHMNNVASLGVEISKEMGLGDEAIKGIHLGSIIHDIGKLRIPLELLTRPGKLEPAEFEIIKIHPHIGSEMLSNIEFPWPVREIVSQHHEKLDGSGYPNDLKKCEIGLEAQIVAVADIVESVSSDRPYRKSLGIERALEIIEEESKEKLNPEVVSICCDLFERKNFKFSEFQSFEVITREEDDLVIHEFLGIPTARDIDIFLATESISNPKKPTIWDLSRLSTILVTVSDKAVLAKLQSRLSSKKFGKIAMVSNDLDGIKLKSLLEEYFIRPLSDSEPEVAIYSDTESARKWLLSGGS